MLWEDDALPPQFTTAVNSRITEAQRRELHARTSLEKTGATIETTLELNAFLNRILTTRPVVLADLPLSKAFT